MSLRHLIVLSLLIFSLTQESIQLGKNIHIQNIDQVAKLDPMTCEDDLNQISKSVDTWSEIIENQSQIKQDEQNLRKIQVAVENVKEFGDSAVFLQIRTGLKATLSQLRQENSKTEFQKWRQETSVTVENQLIQLDSAENKIETDDYSDRISDLLDKLVKEREEIRKSCTSSGITINIINSKQKEVEQTKEKCQQQKLKTQSFEIDLDEAPQTQEKAPSTEELSSSSEEEEKDNNLVSKKFELSFQTVEPIHQEEKKNEDDGFQEYGYGFWAKFLIGYPIRLPKGKDASWYFVSRLSANKIDKNIEMGDRLLAIWLGKGYYHFTTCDDTKKEANLVQNINYPEDIDGLWTYIYYSYSIEAKKAVAFIQFYNEDEPRQANIETINPFTKYLRFTIGGTDSNRYPSFNGFIKNIFFTTQKGAYIEKDTEIIAKLQSERKQPLDFMPELISYKIVTQTVTRTEKTQYLKQIVGNKRKQLIPHEYAMSGWFKWEQVTEQQDWHNVFRVQIAEPQTDKFLGDRTLTFWIGKELEGVAHFATYTYKTLEGEGNPNVFKSIKHNNRINQWFYVYFGYSKPLQLAYGYIKWMDSNDQVLFEKLNHYSVPIYYIYVGKDRQYAGFNGQMSFVQFNLGEGAFKKETNFESKGDEFGFSIGMRQLQAKQDKPLQEIEDEEDEDDGINFNVSFESNKPMLEEKQESEENFEEYGYGFWARFLTMYPSKLMNGKNAPWYFLSRLTMNKEYQNIGMGDRMLAIWLGLGYYHFTTCDQNTNEPNVPSNINHPVDIEGVWTYIYYSYSQKDQKAIAFIKFEISEPKTQLKAVKQPLTKYLKLIIGGKDNNRYPGFNGVFSQIHFNTKLGSFLDTTEEFEAHLQRTITPKMDLNKLYRHEVVDTVISRTPEVDPDYDVVGGKQERFPHEYAISGWFKWQPCKQSPWHTVFRVQVNKPSTDKYMTDRTLSLWIGTNQGGILHFPTYTYTDMIGGGNANLVRNIQHLNRHTNWFFTYFGYSKNQKKAYVVVRFNNGIEAIEYNGINHFYAAKYYIYTGRDKHFPGFNGQLGYVNFVLGEGAFRDTPNFKHENDVFGLEKGNAVFSLKPQQPQQQNKEQDSQSSVMQSAVNENKPKAHKEYKSGVPLKEYGYGYWVRYMSSHPIRLIKGKSAQWYFLSRMTANQKYDNIGMGDRMLAMWLGQGYYHFTTCDKSKNQPNVVSNVNYPKDIEGLWTYIYYSYSVDNKKAVGFVIFNNLEPIRLELSVIHPETQYLQVIIGGKDQNRYPALNGQFAYITTSANSGIFIDSKDQLLKKLEAPKSSPLLQKFELSTTKIIDSTITREVATNPIYQVVNNNQLSGEYSISGWYKWTQVEKQQEWHQVYRVQLTTPSTDRFLGDRTLAAWIGSSFGGVVHLTTYNYENMSGQGQTNLFKNIKHQERHQQWFFIYQAYSRQNKAMNGYVKWAEDEDLVEWKDLNHYLASQFFVFLGKDKQYPGFSGQIAYVNFNLGDGAYKKGNNFIGQSDIFSFDKGMIQFYKSKEEQGKDAKEEDIEEDDAEDKVSAFNNNAPTFQKTMSRKNTFEEYGYGFWFKYMSTYPKRLIYGKNASWYFLSRLTYNKEYQDIKMGDRTLAIWQGQGFYHFTTCNIADNKVNVYQNINYPEDIDGVWTYVYYSYSINLKKAVGFLKFDQSDSKQITHAVSHPPTLFLQLIIGGMENNKYPGFNGVISKVKFTVSKGAFIDTSQKFEKIAGSIPVRIQRLEITKFISNALTRKVSDDAVAKTLTPTQQTGEYSISGWFNWNPLSEQDLWHILFRISINTPQSDKFLGDRTLACWLGKTQEIIHFTTYSYTDMAGGGKNNIIQNIQHNNRHNKWFFLYFGYSKQLQQAYGFIQWTNDKDAIEFDKIKHYYAHQLFIHVGKDKFYPGFNGDIAYINVLTGKGAFKKSKDYSEDTQLFTFKLGITEIKKKTEKSEELDITKLEEKLLENKSSEHKEIFDKRTDESNKDTLKEYGYGYWMRYLTVYPERQLQGKNQPWYFISRLTMHINYDNIRMGDRMLANWQGQGYYHFTTCNTINNQVNVIQNINYPDDIEGLWTYVYYSYSVDDKEAIAFIKYGDDEFKKITHKVTHPSTKQVRFILGGTDQKRYPGFNGLFSKIYFSDQVGVFINSEVKLKTLLSKFGSHPQLELGKLQTNKVVENPVQRQPNDDATKKDFGDQQFATEYAVSGWFKWVPTSQQTWHNIFRVQIKSPSTDQYLGDRTLALWLGTPEGGILHFPTYTYVNMNGAGNANYYKNIQHKNRHTIWFFVYFGYSKQQSKAQAYIKWSQSEDTLQFLNANHYFAKQFFMFLGRDTHFQGLNGQLAYINFNLGPGSFIADNKFDVESDVFNLKVGLKQFEKELKEKPPQEPEKPIQQQTQQQNQQSMSQPIQQPIQQQTISQPEKVKEIQQTCSSGFDEKKPAVDESQEDENNIEEYGYGFWARFLITYPKRLISGKDQPWYFVSRLTQHKEYDNIRMGDRLLAIWQGQGYYHYTTCNLSKNQVNVVQNIDYPNDLDGLWTYIYYSFSVQKSKAVGFIKYGETDVKSIKHDVTHPQTKNLRFILGGTDEGRYSGFNGQFSQITFGIQKGIFVEYSEAISEIIKKKGIPTSLLTEVYNHKIVQGETLRSPQTPPVYKIAGGNEQKFPQEYAISGWFKWTEIQQQQWHNVFRVSIKSPQTDKYLGDRTLSCWLGTVDGGILHFPTYTYTNLVGAGNANYFKNISHKNRHNNWFFVYFGYSQKYSQAYVYVRWKDTQDFLTYDNTKHFLVPQFYIYVGKDEFFPGLNGKLGYVNFNLGRGVYQRMTDFSHPDDIFGFSVGNERYSKKSEIGFKPTQAETTLLESSFQSTKPIIDREIPAERSYEEYGYGFWLRYLTIYPDRMVQGKSQPWYFIARLTSNKNYADVKIGDRLLAIWLGQSYYHLATCNTVPNDNVAKNVNYPNDIDGLWTYIYYSYSSDDSKAVGYIKFGDDKFFKINHLITHPATQYLRFIIGGNDQGRYPGFNGQIVNLSFTTTYGAFVDEDNLIIEYLQKYPIPSIKVNLLNSKIVKDKINRKVEEEPIFTVVGGGDSKFPQEYAFSGWFRWNDVAQKPWHSIFRVSIRKPANDQVIGDRTLSCWLGNGYLHFPTYTYTNMIGQGNSNYFKNIDHKNRHFRWFFVYFGYSKKIEKANVFVRWLEDTDKLIYDNVKHYSTPQFYVYVGKDELFPGFNGQIGQVNFNLGDGSYRNDGNLQNDQNIFGLDASFTKRLVQPFDLKERETKLLSSGFNSALPTLERNINGDGGQDIIEYGYGFWCRFLTNYPSSIKGGLKADWSFIARVTKNTQLADIGLGDRTLALWQGKGFYHFTTYSGNNPNLINNINYPADIEGLWTFIYHSHSIDKKQSIAFVKFGNDKIIKNVQAAEHIMPDYLKFYLGGKHLQYQGYNGQFQDIIFSISHGIFTDSEETILKIVQQIRTPGDYRVTSITKTIIENEKVFDSKTEIKEIIIEDAPLSNEYAWSGWFKWVPTNQQPWHLGVRLAINQNSENIQYMGDRTLCMWIGTFQGGIMHFSTYSYVNINGEGNTNSVQNIAYKGDLTKWHFTYFGYSRTQRLAQARVEFKSRTENLDFKNHNHFVPNKFSLYVGKDKWSSPYSGTIAYFRFNAGEQSFQPLTFQRAKDDIFGYSSGKGTLVRPEFKLDIGKAVENKIFPSAQDAIEPIYQRVIPNIEMEGIEEYGYGFWCRFLSHYPKQLYTGLRADWSFMARLTKNEKLGDVGLGDRTLALWLGKGFYHFTTYNNAHPSAHANINHPDDIEGIWTYIHFSHSLNDKQSIALFKFGSNKVIKAVIPAQQISPSYLKFYLGGKDNGYPSYNGQYAKLIVSTGLGIYINNEDNLMKLLNTITKPEDFNTQLKSVIIVEKKQQFKSLENTKEKIIEGSSLVGEYAWSGWFKWSETDQQPWHLMARLAVLQSSENISYLGDRALCAWVGKGYLHFTTYSYKNVNGGGDVNIWNNIDYEDDKEYWHFVYFGYSKLRKEAFVKVDFHDRNQQHTFKNANHYLPLMFSFYLAKDKWSSTYSGTIAFLRFHAGSGSYLTSGYENAKDDIFGKQIGQIECSEPPTQAPEPVREQEFIDSAFNEEPAIKKEFDKLTDVDEYGYGFYMRYMQEYPKQMRGGKPAPWYEIARMSNNKDDGDGRMGDRTLATWQGIGIYTMATYDLGRNPNVWTSVPQGDIDGVWTFVYYSYSLKQQTAVYILKYTDNSEVYHREFKVNHGKQTYLKCTIGGKSKFYPGFNGQIANYVIKIGPNAFVKQYDRNKKMLLSRIPIPNADDTKFKQIKYIKEKEEFEGMAKQENNILEVGKECLFQTEYAISGWIRWSETKQPQWLTTFRLSQSKEDDPPNISNLIINGFALYKHAAIYRFHTYTYYNMHGGGNAWLHGDVGLEDQESFWHFIYMGYSKAKRQFYGYIQFMEKEQSHLLRNVNHFMVGKHYLQFGRDYSGFYQYYRGFTGIATDVRLSYGQGSFRQRPMGKDKKQLDIFGYDEGKNGLFPSFERKDLSTEANQLLKAESESNEKLVDIEIINGEDDHVIEGLKEYGWSMWCKWLRTGPQPMPWRTGWHNMARLTDKRDHRDGWDRTLALWLGWGFYHFALQDVAVNIPHNRIEDQWHFISFSYQPGENRAVVIYDKQNSQEGTIQRRMPLIKDYLRFIVGKEFGYKFYNGYMNQITLRLGNGAYMTRDEAKQLAFQEQKIPENILPKQDRKTIELLKDKQKVDSAQDAIKVNIDPEDAEGKLQYAISGWAKWLDPPSQVAYHLLYRVTFWNEDTYANCEKPGDCGMMMWKGPGYFHTDTYHVDEYNGGNWHWWQNIDYRGTMHKNWLFFYQGYDKEKQRAICYIKFPTHEGKVYWKNVNQFTPYLVTVLLHKDKIYQGYHGSLEQWYFNLGQGSYRESNFIDDGDKTFGLLGRKIEQPKSWKHDDIFDNAWGPEHKVGVDVTYEDDDTVDALEEYGYGMWTRYAWNAATKQIHKPAWAALSRLTYQEDYQRDASWTGDRALAIWIGPGVYHFTTSDYSNANIWTNINYDLQLDGQWNYIWFGYKRTPQGGRVAGHVLFNGQSVRSTNYGRVDHIPITDFFYLAVGSSGQKLVNNYHGFNGQIGLVSLKLGPGGFIETADQLRKAAPNKPSVPILKDIKETILDKVEVFNRGGGAVDPYKEFEDEFADQYEYSVSLWYKYTPTGGVPWQHIYTLSYHEPAHRENAAKPGDRVLSLFDYVDHRQFFGSYTTPNLHDNFAHVWTECKVIGPDVSSWIYAYYGYSRNSQSIYAFHKTRSSVCQQKQIAMHRVPRYLSFFLGKDGIHWQFNGKFQHVYLMAGPGSYKTDDFLSFDPYTLGAEGIVTKPIKWNKHKEIFTMAYDQEPIKEEFEGDEYDGQTSYAVGVWTRFLLAIPKRLRDKQTAQLYRFTSNVNSGHVRSFGDRVLAIYLTAGEYAFRTHNVRTNQVDLGTNISYRDELEGEWNFIYFSYSGTHQQAVGFVKFGRSQKVERVQYSGVIHNPMQNYGQLIFGKEFMYQGVNGQFAELTLLFGGSAYIADTSTLEKYISNSSNQPDLDEPKAVKVEIQDEMKTKALNDAPQLTEWEDEHEGALEYSVFGWFRYSNPVLARNNNVFLRLSNNEPAYRREFGQVGDRTLLIMLQPREVVFATYTLGLVDRGYIHNIRKPTLYGNNFGLWTYVWMGYSWHQKRASGVVKYPSNTADVQYPNVLHMVPKYLALFAGSDGMLGGWIGQMQRVGAIFGKGAYIDTRKGNFLSLMPEVTDVEAEVFKWKPEKDDVLEVPLDKKAAFDQQFKEEAGGVTEYAYGLWTRWLMTIPERVNEKSPIHQLIRLTNTEKYEDSNQLGNRVLAVFIGKGYYHFTTYDITKKKASIAENIDYGDYLEGHWNYIYFSFTAKNNPRAIGFVHFGDLRGTQINRVEFQQIKHNPFNGYARLVVANNEFGYPSFNGMIKSITLNFNEGFIGSKEQLISEILKKYPKPLLTVPIRADVSIQKEQKNFGKDEQPIKEHLEQFQGVPEYAVSGWIQPKRSTENRIKSIFRLTINDPKSLQDKRNAGDRTLAGFMSNEEYIFSTYDYGDLDSNADDQNDLAASLKIGNNKGDWVFMYFGYDIDIRQAFCYTYYQDRQDNFLFKDIKHFIPNEFWFYLGNDGFYQAFEGVLYSWNLHMGDGSFTLKPKDVIELWPFEPEEDDPNEPNSVILSNQGLSSVKLLRGQPLSGGFDISSGPLSGGLDIQPGAASGTLDDAPGPESGNLEVGENAKSGTLDQGQRAQSGQIEGGDLPKSGQIKEGSRALSGQLEKQKE